jgi:hypothetical protein
MLELLILDPLKSPGLFVVAIFVVAIFVVAIFVVAIFVVVILDGSPLPLFM